MSINVSIVRAGESNQQTFETTITGLDLFGEDRSIVAMKLNGETKDLAHEVADGDLIEPIEISSEEGLAILRHSAGHVTAQALQQIFTEAKLGIGPPITDGYYYDFQVDPLTPDDLKSIEKQMTRIIKEKQRFVRRVVSDEQAREELAAEPFLSLIHI